MTECKKKHPGLEPINSISVSKVSGDFVFGHTHPSKCSLDTNKFVNPDVSANHFSFQLLELNYGSFSN
jgi:hypothetical protein